MKTRVHRISEYVTQARRLATFYSSLLAEARLLFQTEKIEGLEQEITDEILAQAGHGDIKADDLKNLAKTFMELHAPLELLLAACARVRDISSFGGFR